uniref:Phytanoyl-CoA dioxygenase family protein n=1 Tax=Rhizophora mucronata TaxID=61149 RepID=A0A2P2JKQ0_RHIMU
MLYMSLTQYLKASLPMRKFQVCSCHWVTRGQWSFSPCTSLSNQVLGAKLFLTRITHSCILNQQLAQGCGWLWKTQQ